MRKKGLNTFKETKNKRIQHLVIGLEVKPSPLLQKIKKLEADDFSEKNVSLHSLIKCLILFETFFL